MSKKFTQEEVIRRFKEVHGDRYDYSKFIYQGSNTKGLIICNICKRIFEQVPHHHLQGEGCRVCNNKQKNKKLKYTTKSIKVEFKKVHNNIYNYDKVDYQGINQKIIIICKIHGEFLQSPSKHLCGQGCTYCNRQKKNKNISINIINKKGSLLDNNPELCKEWDYEKNSDLKPDQVTCGSHKKVWWLCSMCNRIWQASIKSRTSLKTNCPYCNTWQNQEKCREIFENIFKVKLEKKRFYPNRNRRKFIEFDGYNEELKIAFEYQSIQHYKYPNHFHKTEQDFLNQQKRDLLKIKYCKKNKIKLIEIKYDIKKEYFKKYIKDICQQYNIKYCKFDF